MGDPQDLQASLKKIHAYMSGSYDPQSLQAKTIQTDLEKLYDTFIRPISDLLDGMKPEDKLVFALDDVLTNVPFSILLDAKTGKYLIENHTISFTPVLRVLAQCNERFKSMCHASQRVGQSVALGDPAYRQDKRLVHSLKEVTKISEFFQDGCVKVITGPEASIDNLLNSVNLPVDTVQGFCSHSCSWSYSSSRSSFHQYDQGIVESDEPEEEAFNETLHKFEMLGIGCVRGGSTSVLTEDKCISEKDKKAGILRSENVVKLGFEWRSRMVLKTEGVVGLPQSFLVAGVPCVVASQWSLKDEPNSKLMKSYITTKHAQMFLAPTKTHLTQAQEKR
ncbi:unnamed protein product [Sphagnum jensenii]|uniref:CHAT domain-containing protein n=1 Tax=Sphagnum jensenii TaxID=128206 RepID=A0ABP1ATQ9_9BRYO